MNHLVQTLKWVLVVRGIVAIMFGLAAIALPGLTVKLLIVLFGLTILVDGFINLIGGIQSRRDLSDWWVYVLEGFFSLILGFITILWPNITGVALLFIIASWAIITGIGKMVAAIGMRKLIEGELILLLAGILSVIFGVVMLVFPEFTILAFVGVIGFFSILIGVFMLSLAWRIRQEHHQPAESVRVIESEKTVSSVRASEEVSQPEVVGKPAKTKTATTKKTVAKSATKPKTSSKKETKPKTTAKKK